MNSYSDINFFDLDINVVIEFISKKCDSEIKMLLELTEENLNNITDCHELAEEILILQNKFSHFKGIVEYHIRKEELILFPFLKKYANSNITNSTSSKIEFPKLGNPIQIIQHDHQKILMHLNALQSYYMVFNESTDTLIKLCIAGLKNLDACIKENFNFHKTILFPKIIELQQLNRNMIN